jgi:hypothetical protein
MKHRVAALVLFVAGFVSAGPGCSGRSIVIGGDPLDSGDDLDRSGSSSSGGAFVSGGSGGSVVTGGVGIGGASGTPATGGTLVPTGGAVSSTGGAQSVEGGADGVGDPYPRVAWEEGQGYRRSCPRYDDGTWGFTCWNVSGAGTNSCGIDGSPYCNACSCAVPCGPDPCPFGLDGHPAICVGTETTQNTCFLECDDEACPTGMTCARFPGTVVDVCVWVSEQPFGQPPL